MGPRLRRLGDGHDFCIRSLARAWLGSFDSAASPLYDLRGDCEAHRAIRIHSVVDQNELLASQVLSTLDLRGYAEIH